MPALISWQGGVLERSYLPGKTLMDQPVTDPAFYPKALALLHRIHRRGVAHNDLAKRGNWVVTEAGGRVTDVRGAPLDFGLGRGLSANKGVIVTNGALHDEVVARLATDV